MPRIGRTVLIPAILLASGVLCATLALWQSPAAAQENPDKATTAGTPERQISASIDREIAKVWERDGIKPAKEGSDEEFIRRVYFDTVGVPPTPAEVRAFLGDKDKEKRRALITRLVDDKRFGQHLADIWTNILLGRAGRDYGGTTHLFSVWFAERVQSGASFRDIIYDVVTAKGQLSENPAVAPYIRAIPARTADIAGTLTRNLTGVQIQCAQCHDHPYEEAWTESVFTGVASFFAPVNVRLNNRVQPVDPEIGNDARPVRVGPRVMDNLPAEAKARVEEQARYNKPVTLDGYALKTDDRDLWRMALAKWMVSKDNKQTARYIANRFWSMAFGIGLLNPVDDFNSLNDPTHPELLNLLGDELIAGDYDFRRIYRAILNSRTYQVSSEGPPKKAEAWHFASAPVRQLSPEQFFGAFVAIAGGDDLARGYRARNASPAEMIKRRMEQRMRRAEKEKEDPNAREVTFSKESLDRFVEWYEKLDDGWYLRRTAAQQYASLSSDDEMTEADGFSLTMDQALAVMNGDITSRITGAGRGTVLGTLLREKKDERQLLDELYLRVLSRHPQDSERRDMLGYIKQQKATPEAWEDVMFALIASTEFATNH
jgi:hypothetical protein